MRILSSLTAAIVIGTSLMTGCANPLATNSFNSGVEKYVQGDYQGAIADWNKAIEIDPQYADAYLNRGLAKAHLEDYQGAITDFTKSVEINPQYADAYFHRGLSKGYWKRDYQGALPDYNKAIEIDPQHFPAYRDRGIIRRWIGDLKGACADWRKAAGLGLKKPAEWVKKQC